MAPKKATKSGKAPKGSSADAELASPRLRSEESVGPVRRLLGWTTTENAVRVRPATVPMAPNEGEFVFFTGFFLAGLHFEISSFLLTLLDFYGLQLNHLTPNSILYIAIFVHFCEMFVGVPPCLTLFRHFFSYRASGGALVGGYYFQARPGAVFPILGKAPRWENWRRDWVYVRCRAHDRLSMPTAGPSGSQGDVDAMPELGAAYNPILQRFQLLVDAGLRGEAVLMDFLRRRIAPLQSRTRLASSYYGVDDGIRAIRGAENDFSQEELAVMLHALIGAADVGRTDLPPGVVPLCTDPNVRRTILDSLPALDDIDLARAQGHRAVVIGGTRPGGRVTLPASDPAVGATGAAPPDPVVEATGVAPSDPGVEATGAAATDPVPPSTLVPGGSGKAKANTQADTEITDAEVAAAAVASHIPRRLIRSDGTWVGDQPGTSSGSGAGPETATAPTTTPDLNAPAPVEASDPPPAQGSAAVTEAASGPPPPPGPAVVPESASGPAAAPGRKRAAPGPSLGGAQRLKWRRKTPARYDPDNPFLFLC
jgi:Putative gypsy type transposon